MKRFIFFREDDLINIENTDVKFPEEPDFPAMELYHEAENLECNETTTEKTAKRSKFPVKNRNKDEFYFKHKTYGKFSYMHFLR